MHSFVIKKELRGPQQESKPQMQLRLDSKRQRKDSLLSSGDPERAQQHPFCERL
jgi:hypothetical protein